MRRRPNYGDMDVSKAQEVNELREENARLKRLVANLSSDKDALQSVIRKHSLSSYAERTEVQRAEDRVQ